MSEKAFKVIKLIPFSSLRIGTVIRKNINGFFINGINVPFFNEEIAKTYCTVIEIFKRQIENDAIVFFKLKPTSEILQQGVVTQFDEYTNLYQIKYKKNNRTCTKILKLEEIVIPKEYYFLSSKGIIQKDVSYRDEEADKWRKAVGNFFEDKKDCQAYRQKIIDSFKK